MIQLPIVIGTVPQRRLLPPLPSILSQSLSLSGWDPSPPYPDPPPSYMECIQSATDLVDPNDLIETASLYGETRFVPMYCYVNDGPLASPPEYSENDPFPLET